MAIMLPATERRVSDSFIIAVCILLLPIEKSIRLNMIYTRAEWQMMLTGLMIIQLYIDSSLFANGYRSVVQSRCNSHKLSTTSECH